MKGNSSNSSNGFALDVPVELKRSPRLAVFYLFTHIGALASVVAVSLPLAVRIGMVFAISASLVSIWRRHVSRKHRHAIQVLRPSGMDSLGLVLGDHREELVTRIGPVFVHPWVVLASVHTDCGCYAVVVPRDATSAEGFHRLRVFLHTNHAG
jgi:hypothetical protein